MAKSPYPTYKQSFGTMKKHYNDRYDPRLIEAIDKYKAWHKATFGSEPSRSDIISTAVLQHNDKIRGYYNTIVRKEKQNDRRYLDIINGTGVSGIHNAHPVWREDFEDL